MKKTIITTTFTTIILIGILQTLGYFINQHRLSAGHTGLEAFIPLPSTILTTFLINWQTLIIELLYTLEKALGGFIVGTTMGIFIAIFIYFIPSLRHSLMPFCYGLNSFPIMGFAPAIILIFGQGSAWAIIFISALICFFPTLVSVDSSFRHSNKDLLDVVTILKASKLQKLTKIHIPLALSNIFLAMRISIPGSIIGATMGEWLGSRNGIGQLVTIALYQLNPGILYAALTLLTISSLLITLIIFYIEKKVLPWKFETN
ncbi:MAG: ABC transporter permease subunit [Candidatus Gracilibacteria bacterium]|jgi:ABC-type nitrate/sulfonate/bicarbonate transport system permease component|nr:ABC transporter permease subunit [Candidatus Gracilibacteria bacterium]